MVDFDLRKLIYRDLQMTGATVAPAGTFERVLGYIESKRLRPVLAETYPLKELAKAQQSFMKKNYVGGAYAWGRGNVIETAGTTAITIDTDAGLSGVGEFCPCGDNYMEAYQHGTEAAARLLAPVLLGEDPRQLARIERLMDNTLRGHGYAKAPFDAACWDILGKASGQPVWMLLGGKLTDGAPLYRPAPQKSPDEMVREMNQLRQWGYRQFQIKVGADWKTDIDRIEATVPALQVGEKAMADANQGWHVDTKRLMLRAPLVILNTLWSNRVKPMKNVFRFDAVSIDR